MKELFKVNCSISLAKALGAFPMKLSDKHNHLSFKVYNPPDTYYAELETENGKFVWLWQLDNINKTIET